MTRTVHEWKRRSSLTIRAWYRNLPAHYFEGLAMGDRFWQPKYYSFSIFTRRKLEEKLTYMHLNPVRAGLVSRATDWAWSASRWYEWGRTVGVPLAWVPGLEHA
jgi:putative transposase